jgi:glutaredoxin 3
MSQYVDNLIKSHKVTVFSKTYCPYCVKAKNVLNKYNLNDIKVIELDDREDSDQIQEYLKKLTGARTVIRIFL